MVRTTVIFGRGAEAEADGRMGARVRCAAARVRASRTPARRCHRLAQLVIAAVVCCGLVAPGASAAAAGSTPPVTVTVGAVQQPIPPGFFGLGFETSEVAGFAAVGASFDRMIALLRPGDRVPLPVRIGGRSADETVWRTAALARDRRIEQLDPSWPDELARVVRADGLRIELTVNLPAHSPAMAVRFVSDVERSLPRGALSGVAVGNEPDLYRLHPFLNAERVATTTARTPAAWTATYSPARYASDFRAYAQALGRAFPGVKLSAPDLSFPSLEWPTDLLRLRRFAPAEFTFHRYGTAACTASQLRRLPDAAGFLNDRYTHGLARTMSGDIAFAQAHHLIVRISEMNSVSCGGPAELAQSFATALWAPDALFEMARAGIAAVNWHIRAAKVNAPVVFEAHGMQARPELYGLALYARMIGLGAALLPVRTNATNDRSLKVWAVGSRRFLRLLLINRGASARTADIPVPARVHGTAGTLIRLLAPSVTATAGVMLAGQTIGPDGRWHGRRATERVRVRNGSYRVVLGGYSAALLTLW